MRTAEITRKTAETDITVSINLDGGECEVNTGIGFLTICCAPLQSTEIRA